MVCIFPVLGDAELDTIFQFNCEYYIYSAKYDHNYEIKLVMAIYRINKVSQVAKLMSGK